MLTYRPQEWMDSLTGVDSRLRGNDGLVGKFKDLYQKL